MGRGFLWPLVYGEEGVGKAIRILKHEVETAMALLGVGNVGELGELHVSFSSLPYSLLGGVRTGSFGNGSNFVDRLILLLLLMLLGFQGRIFDDW